MPCSIRGATGFVVFAVVAALTLLSGADAADLHRLFEDRCGRCHGHAGDFARQSLTLEEGVVKGGKTGRDVRIFLPRHFGRLTREEIDLLHNTFALQIESDALFQKKCRVCHGPAKELARLHLIVRDGVLRGRYSDADMNDFLPRHGRTTPEEAALLYRVLLWQRHITAP